MSRSKQRRMAATFKAPAIVRAGRAFRALIPAAERVTEEINRLALRFKGAQ